MKLSLRSGKTGRPMRRGIITISTRLSLTSKSASRHHSLNLSTDGTEQKSLPHLQNDRANAVILRVKATFGLAVHLEPLPFRPSTVPTYAGIFPTDFSSTMPSADCLWALGDIAAAPLQAAVFFVSPAEARFVGRSRRPAHAKDVVQPVSSIIRPRFLAEPLGSPGVLQAAFNA